MGPSAKPRSRWWRCKKRVETSKTGHIRRPGGQQARIGNRLRGLFQKGYPYRASSTCVVCVAPPLSRLGAPLYLNLGGAKRRTHADAVGQCADAAGGGIGAG